MKEETGSYEIIDHTGDIGLRARAGTVEALFGAAARGMYEILVEMPPVRPQREEAFVVEGETDELFRGWLAELLYRFLAGQMVFTDFNLRIEKDRLTAKVRGEKIDAARALRTEL